jgi:hypothetical protein
MEILRVKPYGSINVTFTVPSGFTDETNFDVLITDLSDLSVDEQVYQAVTGDVLSISLPEYYDNGYRVQVIFEGEETLVLMDETYDIVRPYVDPTSMGETASEIAEYTKYEEIARAIIDSVVTEGFYYQKKTLDMVGLGADYLPLWTDAKKILAVYENNVLVTDRTYEITKDKTAITEKVLDRVNRDEQAKLILPTATSDIVDANLPPLRGFPNGYDYRIVVETGHTSVPSDIKRATELLIDDIKCGKIDYYQRYITSYNTDQFRLQFDKRLFEGTGNIVVDKILSKYTKSITRLGVL